MTTIVALKDLDAKIELLQVRGEEIARANADRVRIEEGERVAASSKGRTRCRGEQSIAASMDGGREREWTVRRRSRGGRLVRRP